MKTGVIVGVLATVCSATAHAEERFAHVAIEGVVVALSKVDGTKWDGGGKVSADLLGRFSAAAAKFGIETAQPEIALAGVVGLLGSASLSFAEKPDTKGSAQLFVDGVRVGKPIAMRVAEETFTPQWPGVLEWSRVPIDRDVRIRVVLVDQDTIVDDPIGTAIITSADLRKALAYGKVFPVAVADQTSNQVVAIKVSAMLEGAAATPSPELDVDELVRFTHRFANAIVDNQDDCDSMTTALNSVIDANAALIARVNALRAAGGKLPLRAQEAVATRGDGIREGIRRCSSSDTVRSAIKRLSAIH
ncbi:MAG: hypothetical protein KF773_14265 [Deltaproteobacteria bacterium]|nr:hypothetical protein [Deltaproteobacteria bacterium]